METDYSRDTIAITTGPWLLHFFSVCLLFLGIVTTLTGLFTNFKTLLIGLASLAAGFTYYGLPDTFSDVPSRF